MEEKRNRREDYENGDGRGRERRKKNGNNCGWRELLREVRIKEG